MSRVLLFVQTGEGRPKCTGGVHARSGAVTEAKLGDRWYRVTMMQKRALHTAYRWWLVECENAEAGRAIITHDALRRTSIGKAFDMVPPVVKSRDPKRVSDPVYGRILASGGQSDD